MVLPKRTSVRAPSERTPKKKDPDITPSKRSGSASRSPARQKSPNRTKSPGRQKSPGRTKSPGRPKSPSRTKAQTVPDISAGKKSSDVSKSPSRTSNRIGHLTPTRRSPIRSSPSRLIKDKEKVKESSIPVPKKQMVIETDSDSDSADEKVEIKEKPKAAVRGRTRTDLIEKVEYKKEPSADSSTSSRVSKRFTRSQQKEVERIIHLRHFDTISKKLSEFSDEDDLVRESSVPAKSKKLGYDFGGAIGLMFLLSFFPALGYFFYIACNKRTCSFTTLPERLGHFSVVSYYFHLQSSLVYISYVSFVALLCSLPFGGRKVTGLPDKQGKFTYVTNGLFSAIVVLAVFILLEVKNIRIVNFVLDHQLQLYTTSLLVGILLSIYAYIRSFYVPVSALNPHIIDKSRLYNFFMGRELNPRVFGTVDLKMFVYKLVAISELLNTFFWVYITFQDTRYKATLEESLINRVYRMQTTFLVLCFLQCVRIFDSFIFERAWITSKEVQQEGFGCLMSVSYIIYPFISVFTIKYVVEHNVELAYWKLALIVLTYLAGFYLERASNNQKDAFRKNPYSPSFSHLETIPTSQGKKLLSSGFWGFVRHPNYLGNIITELALVPFVVCAPPVLLKYVNVLFLIHRARRDNNHCKQKYGNAWDRYCNRVRYLLIPKVY